jgi:fucose permease
VVGYFVSRFLGRATLIALVNSQYRSARLIAFLVRGIILIFFIAVATDYIGVGRGIVEATFAIILGGFVLALAIAFGLGGRDIARETLERKLRSLEERKRESDEISHL